MNLENKRCAAPITSKRWSILPIFLLMCTALAGGCHRTGPVTVPVPPSPNKDWTITATWNYDFTNYVPCSASVTKGCINGFTWGYLQGSTAVPLKTAQSSVCGGTTQPQICADTVNSTLGIGSVTFYVVANGVDNTGVAVASQQDTSASLLVSAGTPNGITVSIK